MLDITSVSSGLDKRALQDGMDRGDLQISFKIRVYSCMDHYCGYGRDAGMTN